MLRCWGHSHGFGRYNTLQRPSFWSGRWRPSRRPWIVSNSTRYPCCSYWITPCFVLRPLPSQYGFICFMVHLHPPPVSVDSISVDCNGSSETDISPVPVLNWISSLLPGIARSCKCGLIRRWMSGVQSRQRGREILP